MEEVYIERQRALIERSLANEREREAIRRYQRELEGRAAYFKLQRTKRGKIMRSGKTIVCWKSQHSTMSKGERDTMRTKRFDNSYITVYCKHKPC